MESFRRILDGILKQVWAMSLSGRLLVACVSVIVLLVLFISMQYAGKAELVELLPGTTAVDQAKAVEFLRTSNIAHTVRNDRVFVPVDAKYTVLGQLGRASRLPSDSSVLFANLAEKQNWMMPKSQQDQIFHIAKMNELARVISEWPGIESAQVFIDDPEPRGFGPTFKRPTAQVTVFTEANSSLDAETVDALASMVASAVSGLDPAAVPVIDGAKKKRYKARAPDDYMATSYLEQVAKTEQRIQDKILEHLAYIPDLQVSVNAIVDADRTTSEITKVLPKGSGSEQLLSSERSTSSSSAESNRAAEPGLGSNVTMDINQAGGAGGSNTTDETSDAEYANQFGRETRQQITATGKPRKVNVTVSLPRDYIEAVAQQVKANSTPAGSPPAGPAAGQGATQSEIDDAFKKEEERLTRLLTPLVETEATQGGQQAGSVVVSLIPVPTSAWPGGGRNGAGGAAGASLSGGMIARWAGNEMVKTVGLGVLAVVALGMMFSMVRKAGRPAELPSADELAGIPPALETASDLVGEAEESDNAMLGIEVDEGALKSKRMLEEVSTLVVENPQTAGEVMKRWVSIED